MNISKVDSCIAFLNGYNSPNWNTVVNRLKPGSHIVAICPTLQQHRVTAAMEDCGVEIRDCVLVLGSPSYMVTLGRVPLEGTVAENVLRYGVGAINVGKCRVIVDGTDPNHRRNPSLGNLGANSIFGVGGHNGNLSDAGRWPANVIVQDDGAIRAKFPFSKSCNSPSSAKPESKYRPGQGNYQPQGRIYPGDSGSAARFFHSVPCENSLKDLTLYLTKLITPSEGKVLVYDPSQSAIIALKGMGFVTCEYGEYEI